LVDRREVSARWPDHRLTDGEKKKAVRKRKVLLFQGLFSHRWVSEAGLAPWVLP